MERLIPLDGRVVVKQVEVSEKTPGGILLPDTAQTQEARGKVIEAAACALRSDGTQRTLLVKVGDNVTFLAHAGTRTKINGSEVLVLRDQDIIGIIEQVNVPQ